MASSNKVPYKRLRGTWCQCLLPDSGFDHPDYPSSSCFMNTICENKTQWSTADKSTALRLLFYKHAQLCCPLNTTITSLCSVTYILWQCGTARMPPLLLSINGTDRWMDRRSTVSKTLLRILEHSNSRFEFTSCHAVFLLIYCIVSAKKISWRHWLRHLIL